MGFGFEKRFNAARILNCSLLRITFGNPSGAL